MSHLSWVQRVALLVGFGFLYLPIASVIIYSFNSSDMVTVWAGFSVRWYAALVHDSAVLGAAWLSLRLAVTSATLALVFGTLAGFVLARYRHFGGRMGFAAMVTAPLVVPEVISAIAMLMLFITLNTALQHCFGFSLGRGLLALTIAHAAYAVAFVAVVVQARLAGADRSVEEAALDLGARPWRVFAVITLPLLLPALLSGWLLAFSLSLDDVVTSAFVAGPSATTLPMYIFSSVKFGVNPEVNALGTIVVVLVSIIALISTGLRPKPAEPAP